MPKSSSISARIDPKIKQRAEQIFQQLGLTASQAITLFYRQVEMRKGLPFPVEIPNETTLKALKEAQDKDNLSKFESSQDLYEDLGI
ncbi:MAG: type II toxin-antitoxin system RelB/DinJ family antitoxin [Rhodothermales bacterium]